MPTPSRRPQAEQPHQYKPLALALALALGSPVLLANPNGATVVRGNASIASNGNTMTVTNSPGAIINWQNFSIAGGEITKFVQQNAASTVLNRVTGGNPSSILGSLQSNGHVWLINPNGILFGAGARIDVAGLVASSLNITDNDFANGLHKFSGTGGEGAVRNAGHISAAGGPVLLFAPNVENSGIITSPNGEITLAAGHSVELASSSNPALRVTVTAGGEAVNLGQIIAQSGSASMVGGLVRQAGLISASSVTREGGRIYLRATGQVQLDSNSRTEASGTTGGQIGIAADALIQSGDLSATGSAGAGGSVEVQARFAGLSGATDVSGVSGGTVAVNSESTTLTSNITAAGNSGAGGSVGIVSANSLQQTQNSVIDVASQQAAGGAARLTTTAGGTQYLSGQIKADGQTGGTVVLEGGALTLAGARISATGASQGGQILAGGGAHGVDASVRNADTLRANASTQLDASARDHGDGGEVIVWGDRQASFVGSIAATGGSQGGNGGFVEVSSAGSLGYGGQIDVTAANGQAGSVLFDPYNIHIEELTAGSYTTIELADPLPVPEDSHGSGGIRVLPNGNIVVASPYDSDVALEAGAVYLYQPDGTLVSKLYGTQDYDGVGVGGAFGEDSSGITVLSSGNFFVRSPFWNDDRGAVTWGSQETGVSGPVSVANSVVGGTGGAFPSGDMVGFKTPILLNNGNYVVQTSSWDNGPAIDAGAVTWVDGATGKLADGTTGGVVSTANSLVGTTASDWVGDGLVELSATGNFVVVTPSWDNGPAIDAGAATWINGATGKLADGTSGGAISAANSLVGTTASDRVGDGLVELKVTGNFVVVSPSWDNGPAIDAGAATWINGATGKLVDDTSGGAISAVNSLVGSTDGDNVGGGALYTLDVQQVVELTNGHYVVISPYWTSWEFDGGETGRKVGAVTWVDGSTGKVSDYDLNSGLYIISTRNSLMGSSDGDAIGSDGVLALTNGNYVVGSSDWTNGIEVGAGAATWVDGSTGRVSDYSTSGSENTVSAANSLVGATAGSWVSYGGMYALPNGNYVIASPDWQIDAGMPGVGAVTWGNGATGQLADGSYGGVVSAANSLVGSVEFDRVGSGDYDGLNGVTVLANGNYVVNSSSWGNGKGAVTWGNGATGTVGVVSAANSLVGNLTTDGVGGYGVTALPNGNYVVVSPYWDNDTVADAGAVTWGSGTSGVSGVITSANSLVGTSTYDDVGEGGVTVLPSGNYLVGSPYWNGYQSAVTWVDGSTGRVADFASNSNQNIISSANSIVGSSTYEYVGGPFNGGSIVVLGNGNFVVLTSKWNNWTGAVTWGNGVTGLLADGMAGGVVSAANSLVGSAVGEYVGNYGSVIELGNGNFVVRSPMWNGYAGAVTWINGATGLLADGMAGGVISATNSLVGSVPSEYVGDNGVVVLDNGNYLSLNPGLAAPSFPVTPGSITWGNGLSGTVGVVSAANSLMLSGPAPQSAISVVPYSGDSFVFRQVGGEYWWNPVGGQVFFATQGTVGGAVFGNHTDIDYVLSPSSITTLLDSGANVTLQAHNDINVNAAINANPGVEVTLALEAYNNINLNADITSSGAPMTLHLVPDADSSGAGTVNVLGSGAPRVLDMAGGAVEVEGILNAMHDLTGGGSGELEVEGGWTQASGTTVADFDSMFITQNTGNLYVGDLSVVQPEVYDPASDDGTIVLVALNGDVSQQAGTTLSGAAVGAFASGSVTLTNSNSAPNVLGSAGVNFAYTSGAGLNVVSYDDGVFAHSGIAAGSQVTLAAGGDIGLWSNIVATGGALNIFLTPNAGLGQVRVLGANPVQLSTNGGGAYVYGTLSVENHLSGNGSGELGVTGGFSQAAGFDVSGFNHIFISQLTGNLSVGNLSTTWSGNFDSASPNGVIGLSAENGDLIQQAGTVLTASGLGAAASGSVLLEENNPTGVVGGSAGVDFSYKSTAPIHVTSYDDGTYAISGIMVGNGIQLTSTTGDIFIDAPLQANGNIVLTTPTQAVFNTNADWSPTGVANNLGVQGIGGVGGDLVNLATLSLDKGIALSVDGKLTNALGASLSMTDPLASIVIGGDIKNDGTLHLGGGYLQTGLTGGFINTGSLLIDGNGSYALVYQDFTNQAGASVTVEGTGTTLDIDGSLANAGNLIIGGTGEVLAWTSASNSASGLIALMGGTLSTPSLTLTGGILQGAGTLQGVDSLDTSVINTAGTVTPGGLGIGTLSVTGNYSQGAGGLLDIGIGGTAAGEYDVLAVSGDVALDGTLNASLVNGFIPVHADAFPFLTTGGAATGTFASLTGPTAFSVGYNLATAEAARLIYTIDGANTFTNAAGGLNWGIAQNWSYGVLPGETHDVLISAGHAVIHDSGNDLITSLTINSGNALDVSGGSLTVSGDTLVGGALSVSGGSVALNGLTSIVDLSVSSGSLTVASGLTQTAGTLTQTGGSIQAALAVDGGVVNLNGGSFSSTGGVSVGAAGTLNLAGGSLDTGTDSNLAIAGIFNWGDGALVGTGGLVSVASGGSLILKGGSGADRTLDGRSLINDGTVTLDMDPDSYLVLANGASISNAGQFNLVSNGTPATVGQGSGVAAGSAAGDFSNSGTLAKSGVGDGYINVALHNSGTVSASAGELELAGGGTHTAATFDGNGGEIGFDGAHVLNGATTFNGHIALNGGSLDSAATNGVGSIVNTGTFDIRTDTTIRPDFTNSGTVNKSAGAGTTTFTGSFATTGTINIDIGSLAFAGGLTQNSGVLTVNGGLLGNILLNGGLLNGSGSIGGNVVVNGGTLAPGNSPGALSISGDLTLGSASTLIMELGNPAYASANDQINVGGHFTKGGTLQLAAVNGYVPVPDDSFVLFTFGSESGSFGGMSLPNETVSLSGGLLRVLGQTPIDVPVVPEYPEVTVTVIDQILKESATQISTDTGLLFTIKPVTNDEDDDRKDGNKSTRMSCSA